MDIVAKTNGKDSSGRATTGHVNRFRTDRDTGEEYAMCTMTTAVRKMGKVQEYVISTIAWDLEWDCVYLIPFT
jgi:hypothetical protein